MTIPQAIRAVLETGRLAHLVTLNKDGSPQVSCLLVGVEDDQIVCAHIGTGQKIRNLRRDSRVALSIETTNRNAYGQLEYLVVHGTAEVSDGDAAELLSRLAQAHTGEPQPQSPLTNPPPGHIIRITPTRYGGTGPWLSP